VHRFRSQLDRQDIHYFTTYFFLGDPDISRGDAYAQQQQQQARGGQQGYSAYGTGASAPQDIGQQPSGTLGQGGTGTSGQYGGATTGRGDSGLGGGAQDDDGSYPTGSGGGGDKPSMTGKVQGTCCVVLWSYVAQADVRGGGVFCLSQAPVRGWQEKL
jgi:hypothetical protein